MLNEKIIKRYGKYLIVDHLVNGGMAEIFRARYLSDSADKIVAIKMIQPQFSSDVQFKSMFMDEIQVSFGLIHPNIAQTYEYGLEDGRLFVAMEYVDGKNLKEFLERLRQRKFVFPVEISIYIASQVCQALSYAYNFTDKLSGKKANIIHRDISPHNIMLTYDGAVKVIDFGIAKAESNSESTRAGTIKGKLSYLAPEYLDGLPLDHRYDQFAVGVTLWELLCSRKLFDAPNDLACLKKIQNCDVPPPSSINPNVSKELDQIVLKALSKDRNLRYENMDQFNRALVKFLYANYPDFNATDLGYFAGELFKEEISSDQKKLIEFGKIDIRPYLAQLGQDNIPLSSRNVAKRVEIDLKINDPSNRDATKTIQLDQTTRKKIAATRRGKSDGIKRGNDTNPSMTSNLRKSSTQSPVRIQVKKKQHPYLLIILLTAGIISFGYFKDDLIKKYTGLDIKKLIAQKIMSKNSSYKEVAVVEEVEQGKISLSGLDPYMDLYIDNKPVSYLGFGIPITFGDHVLKVVKKNYKSFVYPFTVSKESAIISVQVPNLSIVKYGALSTAASFSPEYHLIIIVDGEEIKSTLPITNLRLPIGSYDAVLIHPSLEYSEKKISFTIEENKNTLLE